MGSLPYVLSSEPGVFSFLRYCVAPTVPNPTEEVGEDRPKIETT